MLFPPEAARGKWTQGLIGSRPLSLEHGPLTVTASLRNVFNVTAIDRAFTSSYGAGQTFGATPRTISLLLRRR